MTTENIIAFVLIAIAAIVVAGGFVAIYWAISQNTKIIKKQASVVNDARKKVSADLHRKASKSFEKALEEDSEAIRQDIRLTGESMTHFVRNELESALEHELKAFKDSAKAIGQVSGDALRNLQEVISAEQRSVVESLKEQQATVLSDLQVQHQELTTKIDSIVTRETERRIAVFESDMERIVSTYAKQAFVDAIDIDSQLEYIIAQLNDNKQAIIEDLRGVAK